MAFYPSYASGNGSSNEDTVFLRTAGNRVLSLYVPKRILQPITMTRFLIFIKNNWIAFTAAALAVITWLSFWPLDTLPQTPGSDKLHHLIAYAFLTLPAALRKPRRWMAVCLFFIAYSGIIELLQPFVNRYREWADMLANTSGVVCGVIIAFGLNFLFSTGKVHTR